MQELRKDQENSNANASTEANKSESEGVLALDLESTSESVSKSALAESLTRDNLSSGGYHDIINSSYPSSLKNLNKNKITQKQLDMTKFSGKDIIAAVREESSCVIIGISSLILSEQEEKKVKVRGSEMDIHDQRISNTLKSGFVRVGADLVWAKPTPQDAWAQIVDRMPVEF